VRTSTQPVDTANATKLKDLLKSTAILRSLTEAGDSLSSLSIRKQIVSVADKCSWSPEFVFKFAGRPKLYPKWRL
jgi:hypothetical protein